MFSAKGKANMRVFGDAERAAGHTNNDRLVEDCGCHFFAAFAGLVDFGKGVKCAFDIRARHILDAVKGTDYEVAPLFIRLAHHFDAILRSGQRGDGGVLRESGCGGSRLRIEHAGYAHKRGRSRQPSQTPAGHCVGFGHAIDHNDAIGNIWNGCQRHNRPAIKIELLIYFVRNNEQIRFRSQRRNRLDLIRGQDVPRSDCRAS